MRSDQLGDLARLLTRFGPLPEKPAVLCATVILDANVVIADLIWLCRRRRTAEARTNLLELLECSTVKAYAPTYLSVEIEEHLPQLEAELGISAEDARKHWKRFEARITFIEVGGPDPTYPGVSDPKDVAYVKLHKQIALPIVTDDRHLPSMGADVLNVQVFAPMRAYSRQRAVEYQIKAAGIGAVLAAGLAAKIAFDGTRAAGRAIASLPKPVLAIGMVGLLAAWIHPTSRRWLFDRLDNAAQVAGKATAGLYELLLPVMDEHNSAKQGADEMLAAVEEYMKQAGIAPGNALRLLDAAPVAAAKKSRRSPRRRRKPKQVPPPA